MAYIVQRKHLHYVVAYDGVDPITGRERRKWHPAGTDPVVADALLTRLDRVERIDCRRRPTSTRFGAFLTDTWLPRKRTQIRATTAHRYGWMIENYLVPYLGDIHLDQIRTEHLDTLYSDLIARGGHHGRPLSPKTVHEAHLIVRNALDLALSRRLVDHNPAIGVHSPKRRTGGMTVARVWTAAELAMFLDAAKQQRLHPALHLAAHTGMRRGEVAGLHWNDLDLAHQRLSLRRTIQSVAGRPVEFGVKTRTSRRCIDLDDQTVTILRNWRNRLRREGLPYGPDDWMFCNPAGRFLNPESISQVFWRVIAQTEVPRIRFHDLRHTHASLLVMTGVPIKVVSERLGHAHPAFTMHTYQHLLPGMSADAATRFAGLITDASR